MENETFFEARNGWQFKVDENGNMRYKFQEDTQWNYLGTQLTVGLIEWAQSEIWQERVDEILDLT